MQIQDGSDYAPVLIAALGGFGGKPMISEGGLI
jgi:hypothetical protein